MEKMYVTSTWRDTVYVIDTTTNTVTASVPVGTTPQGVAVSPDGTKVYVTNQNSNTVSVIDTATNTVSATVHVDSWPVAAAVTPDGNRVYVTNAESNTVSVINTTTNTVIATVPVSYQPRVIAVTPDGKNVYATNFWDYSVSVIDTTTNTVTATVNVGPYPIGVAITPDGNRAYVANSHSNFVSVIDTKNNTVTATVLTGNGPSAFGQFIVYQLVLPVANFSSNVTNGYAPLSVQFNDSSENAATWNWDFGDGANSTQLNPTHTYSAAGTYTVNLTVSNGNGMDSKTAQITASEKIVLVLPRANEKFKTEIKPPEGAALTFTRTLPSKLDPNTFYHVY